MYHCTKTIQRWDKKGKLVCSRTPGGHRRIAVVEIERLMTGNKTVAIYGRVSSRFFKKRLNSFYQEVGEKI
ncbi:MAG: hypothetical protein ACFFD4_07365 [Candidatus Odinarchaeota archaeon]